MMKKLCVAVVVLLLSGPANLLHAGFVYTLTEVGPDVVVNGVGTLNLSALTLIDTTAGASSGILPNSGYIGVGGSIFTYTGFSGPASFGDGGFTVASSASGNTLAIEANGFLLGVPAGYVSGTPLSNTMTFNNATFASLGFTPGTYIYTWGTGSTADSLTVTVNQQIDTVNIIKAQYVTSLMQLSVQATDTSDSATLTVSQTNSGRIIGTLVNRGGGNYLGKFNGIPNPRNPRKITVTSDMGGSDTARVRAR